VYTRGREDKCGIPAGEHTRRPGSRLAFTNRYNGGRALGACRLNHLIDVFIERGVGQVSVTVDKRQREIVLAACPVDFDGRGAADDFLTAGPPEAVETSLGHRRSIQRRTGAAT
jgi:hypothetical protein